MRALVLLVAATLLAHSSVAETPPPPRKPYHVLLGPYEYDSTREHVPRYFTLDGRRYTTIDALQSAIAALPDGSTVYLRGSCDPYDAVDLPPRPISLSALRAYCSTRHISFTWTFGPGGY
jgi:hypothetical protein